MRKLTKAEIDNALDDNGEEEDGFVAIEATVKELSDLGVGTICGHVGNVAFAGLVAGGFGDKLCRGWYKAEEKCVAGMFHIQAPDEDVAESISNISNNYNGSLRPSGESLWSGFYEFEIE